MVHIVQQRQLRTELLADTLEHGRYVPQIRGAVPILLRRRHTAPGRLIVVALARGLPLLGDAVEGADAGHCSLHANSPVAALDVRVDGLRQRLRRPAGRVTVGE